MQSAPSVNHADEGNSLCNELGFFHAFYFFCLLMSFTAVMLTRSKFFVPSKDGKKKACFQFSWIPFLVSSSHSPHPKLLRDRLAFQNSSIVVFTWLYWNFALIRPCFWSRILALLRCRADENCSKASNMDPDLLL